MMRARTQECEKQARCVSRAIRFLFFFILNQKRQFKRKRENKKKIRNFWEEDEEL